MASEPEPINNTEDTSDYPVWKRFSAWLHAICIVTFDLELGQAMESIYPCNVKLSDEDISSICYLAFPDSNSGCMGDTKFHFRFRQSSGSNEILSSPYKRYNHNSISALQAQASYLYGYVYFRQVKDNAIPRGYFQKSVIILSRLPFVNLFLEICKMIAPAFFETGINSIEAACHDIDQWPFPEPGEIVNLPLLGTLLQVQIPSESSSCNVTVSPTVAAPNIIPSIHLNNLFSCFSTCIHHVHLLWELVITCEPIVVIASSPEICSQMVHSLVTMVLPLRYYAENRPYFTIHDTEFKEYTKPNQVPPPIILGVTNPFFSKTLRHWPHIIKLGEPANPTSSLHKHKIKKGVAKAFDSKAGVYTRYEPFLQRDKTILKKLLKGIQTNRPEEVQSAFLRRHLLELTQSFMIPLERYMATLMPLHKKISPFRAPPPPYPFNPGDFIASLDKSGPHLTSGVKGNWAGLYQRFFRSPNFNGWYNERYKAMSNKLIVLQLEALSMADMHNWLQDKKEVEVVDMIIGIRCRLKECKEQNLIISETIQNRLKRRMDDVISKLPEDLQMVIKNSNENQLNR